MSNIISPHDKLFKVAMSRPEVVKNFLQEHLPAHIKEMVDLNAIKQEPTSFIDARLRKREADILYSMHFGAKQGYIYTLFEHLSNPDRQIAFRILKYMIRIMEWHHNKTKDKNLCTVYPILVYTGAKIYPYSTNFFDLFGSNKKLAESIFLQPVKLLNIKDIPEEKLRKNLVFGLMVKAMLTNTRDALSFAEILEPYLHELDDDVNLISSVITYITYTKNINDEEKFLKQLTTHLTPNAGKTVMTIAEQLKRKGREEGMIVGERKGSRETAERIATAMLHKHQSIGDIAEITQLTTKEIEALQRKA